MMGLIRPESFPQQSLGYVQGLDAAIEQGRELVARVKAEFRPAATVALYSGGNDSGVMLHLVRDQIDFAAHIVTGIGIPEATTHAIFSSNRLGVRLETRITPAEVYEKLVLRYGFPGPHHHGLMYRWLKERRIREIRNEYNRVLFLTGLRSFESRRRAKYIDTPYRIDGNLCWANPINHFDSRLMFEYRKRFDVARSPVSDLIHKSGECLCGAFAKKGEMKELEFWYPKVAAQIHELESRVIAAGKHRCIWGEGHIKQRRLEAHLGGRAHQATPVGSARAALRGLQPIH